QAEDGIRDKLVTGVQTCALPIFTNGDVFEWQNVWPTIADALGMKVGPPEPLSLTREMPRREAEWSAIVQKYDLRAPTSLRAFVRSEERRVGKGGRSQGWWCQ